MTAKIVLLGATGYTGARTAEAMSRRGLRPVLAGRDPGRLAAVASRLGGLDTAHADVTDPASVRALIDRGDVLVSTVGPFSRLGEPVVAAAVDAGAYYLDSTGEPPFLRRVFEEYGPQAERSGATLLPAFGNDFIPGTLAGALALREAGARAAAVDVGYFVRTGGVGGQAFSLGTIKSLVAVAAEPVYSWRDGELRREPAGARLRTFDVAGRPRPGITIGSTEHFALPRLAAEVAPGLRSVDVYLGWFGPASRMIHLSSGLTSLAGRIPLVKRAVTGAAGMLTRNASDEPNAKTLAAMTSHIVAEVFDAAGQVLSRAHVTGPEPYGMTAELLTWAAGRLATEGAAAGPGTLDPVQAFGLNTLRVGAEQAGMTATISQPA
ncbi:MAG: Saccharopine dehydrogenase [Pseudonocardia sp.]|nr:Saccharopine dehydrogenase [Pseudonocardia sp.]